MHLESVAERAEYRIEKEKQNSEQTNEYCSPLTVHCSKLCKKITKTEVTAIHAMFEGVVVL